MELFLDELVIMVWWVHMCQELVTCWRYTGQQQENRHPKSEVMLIELLLPVRFFFAH